MKKNFILLILLISVYSIKAQNTFTTHWENGTLKTHLVRMGFDTLIYEIYRENGTLYERRWANDSIFLYDRRGFIVEKRFFHKIEKDNAFIEKGRHKPDSLLLFYPNEIIREKTFTDVNRIKYTYFYSIKGELEYSESSQKIDKNYQYYLKTLRFNETNQLISSAWTYYDRHITIDTIYYKTGEICSIAEIQADTGYIKEYTRFTKTGEIEHTQASYLASFDCDGCLEAVVHDSIQEKHPNSGGLRFRFDEEYPDTFFIKKEGVFTGLVNLKSHWVLKPQFDEIKTYRGNQFKVKFKGLYGIIDRNLTWLIPPQYNGIEFTHLPDVFIVSKDFDKEEGNEIWSGYTRYGLAKTNENVILPLIYKQIRIINWRSPVFLVETGHPHPITQEEGYRDGHFGLFNAYKGFVVDTIYDRYINNNSHATFSYNMESYNKKSYLIFKNEGNNKVKIFDHFGKPILAAEYDNIEVKTDDMAATFLMCGNGSYDFFDRKFYPNFGYLLVHDKGKSGVYDLDKQQWVIEMNKYDTLVTWLFKYEVEHRPFTQVIDHQDVDAELVLLAKKDNQWWILNPKGELMSSNSFDLMGEIPSYCEDNKLDYDCFEQGIFGVKDNKITPFSVKSYPYKSTLARTILFNTDIKGKLFSFDGKTIFINKAGQIIKK